MQKYVFSCEVFVYVITDMKRTDCIDIELCDNCFTLPCKCIIINMNRNCAKGQVKNILLVEGFSLNILSCVSYKILNYVII